MAVSVVLVRGKPDAFLEFGGDLGALDLQLFPKLARLGDELQVACLTPFRAARQVKVQGPIDSPHPFVVPRSVLPPQTIEALPEAPAAMLLNDGQHEPAPRPARARPRSSWQGRRS